MPDGSQSSPAPMASEKIPQGKYFSVCVKILLFIHRKVETAGVYLILFCFETGMNPLLRKTSISAVNQIMFILFSRLQHLNCYVLFRIWCSFGLRKYPEIPISGSPKGTHPYADPSCCDVNDVLALSNYQNHFGRVWPLIGKHGVQAFVRDIQIVNFCVMAGGQLGPPDTTPALFSMFLNIMKTEQQLSHLKLFRKKIHAGDFMS